MRTTNQKILDSKNDIYVACPNCGSFHLYRDVRDHINSCHGCGFTHFVGHQTVRAALVAWDMQETGHGSSG